METTEKVIRVIMAKPNMDGHWRGIYAVSMALRDAKMEVIYTGFSSPEGIAQAAIQEDADVIGLSLHSCDNVVIVSEVMQILREKGIDNMLVVVGGAIVREDIPKLKELGVGEVFPPGSPLQSIVDYIRKNLKMVKTD